VSQLVSRLRTKQTKHLNGNDPEIDSLIAQAEFIKNNANAVLGKVKDDELVPA
jgi:hypothetical protein